MFSSIFIQRLFKYFASDKKFIINLEVKVFDKYTFLDIEENARFRNDAIKQAIEKTKSNISISVKGSKSLGKIKQFNEF
jgi:hemerythrin superfamily protein